MIVCLTCLSCGAAAGILIGAAVMRWLSGRRPPSAPVLGDHVSWEEHGFTHTGVFIGWEAESLLSVRRNDGTARVVMVSALYDKPRVLPERSIIAETAATYRESAAAKEKR